MKKKAAAANTPYGKALRARREQEQQYRLRLQSSNRRKIHAHSTAVNSAVDSSVTSAKHIEKGRDVCPDCLKTSHKLVDCYKFLQKSHGDRLKIVRKARLCDNCFVYGHMSRNCRKPPACTVDGCRLKHITLLHRREQETCTQTENAAGTHESKVEAYATSKSSAGCFLNIVPVKICANRREIETYAFLDEGSTACLCDERLLDLLKLRGKKTQFSLTTVNAVPTSQDGYAVDFTVKSLDGRESVDLSHVLTVDRLPVKANEAQFDVQSYAHLKGLKIPTLPCKDVMLMIGVNVPKVFWTMDERRGKHDEPSAKKSILGWSLVGPALSHERNSDVHIHCVQVQEEDLLSQQIKCLWESDFKDVSLSPIPSMSKEDKYALQLMEDSVEIVDGHYQLPLPWKPGCPDLPDNRSVAMKRLKYIERKLKSDPVLKKKYCDTMEKYISLGFAKRIPNEYKVGNKGAVWYLPHHPVVSEQKPGKVRVVFDAASR
ncbi:uncharacterized protein LOC144425211 [Styela clava]